MIVVTQIPLYRAQALALRIVRELITTTPGRGHIVTAGSIRRQRPLVNDIDLVVVPESEADRAVYKQRALRNGVLVKDGGQNFIVNLRAGDHGPADDERFVQLDIFFARPRQKTLFEETPTNFGTLFLCRTGSMAHNIRLAQRAQQLGLHWNPYEGVFETELGTDGAAVSVGAPIACETEAAIFKALEMDFVPPEKRER